MAAAEFKVVHEFLGLTGDRVTDGIKLRRSLAIDQAERGALTRIAAGCGTPDSALRTPP